MTLKASSAVAANVANKQGMECADAERLPLRVQSQSHWEVLAVKRIQVYIMNLSVDLGHQVAAKHFGS